MSTRSPAPAASRTAALLRGRRVQLVPHVGAAPGRSQPGQPQLGAVPFRDRLERVELAGVVPGHHDRDLEAGEPGRRQVPHRPQRGAVRPWPAHLVVDLLGRPVERDLDIHVVAGRQPPRGLISDLDAVGGELHADAVVGGVVHEIPEVRPHGGFAATDVDVEDLHPLELVDHAPGTRRCSARADRAGRSEDRQCTQDRLHA